MDGLLRGGVNLVGSHALPYLRHVVGSGDGATHIYGLRSHYGDGIHLTCVGTEGIDKALTNVIDRLAYLRPHLTEHIAEALRLIRCQHALLGKPCQSSRDVALHRTHHIGSGS